MLRWVWLLGLFGCVFSIDGGSLGVDAADAPTDAPDAPPDGTLSECFGAFVPICTAPQTTARTLTTQVINTDTSPLCAPYSSTSGIALCVITGASITIPAGATVTVTGSKALVLLSTAGITISNTATVSVASTRTPMFTGAGANSAACTPGPTLPTAATGTGGGGWGGSFLGAGGAGGAGGNGGIGGFPSAGVGTSTLRGGCPGFAGAGGSGGRSARPAIPARARIDRARHAPGARLTQPAAGDRQATAGARARIDLPAVARAHQAIAVEEAVGQRAAVVRAAIVDDERAPIAQHDQRDRAAALARRGDRAGGGAAQRLGHRRSARLGLDRQVGAGGGGRDHQATLRAGSDGPGCYPHWPRWRRK